MPRTKKKTLKKKSSQKHSQKYPEKYKVELQKQIRAAERSILKAKQDLAKLRRQLQRTSVKDYSFFTEGGTQKLSELFGSKTDLVVIHNMGASCSYCTLWADGFNGILPHLESHVAFRVISADPVEKQQELAKRRGWKFQMVSCGGSSFKKDLGFEDTEGEPIPGVSVFHRDSDGKVYHVASTQFGPGDGFCVLWDLFDLLPGGAGDWEPQAKYSV